MSDEEKCCEITEAREIFDRLVHECSDRFRALSEVRQINRDRQILRLAKQINEALAPARMEVVVPALYIVLATIALHTDLGKEIQAERRGVIQ